MNTSNLVRKDHPKTIVGGALIRALLQKAEELNLDRYALAEAIQITYPYLNALANGGRPVTGISLEKLRRIADFLDMTFVQVLMLAEIIKPEDFTHENNHDLERTLDRAFENMRSDVEWGRVAPSQKEWEGLSLNTKIGIAMMWERVSEQDLIAKAAMVMVDPPKKTNKSFEGLAEGLASVA